MWKLIQLLIFGHTHKWKIIKELPLHINRGEKIIAKGMSYNLQCEHCGNLKSYDDINPGNF